jgi:cardiolipin synthase
VKLVLSLLISTIALLSSTSFANQLLIEPDMGRTPIIEAINQTKQSLHLVMYGFTDEQLLNAILKKHSQHKSIQIILEQTPYKAESENSKTINLLNQNNIEWHGTIPPFRLIHQKTLLIDNDKAIVMTFNFTNSSFKNERNFALIIDDPKQVNQINAVFSADWNHKAADTHIDNLIYSPDNSREKIIYLIQSAHSTINVYAQSISDYKLIGALAAASKKGVNVNILLSNKLREKQENYLRNKGVHIKLSKHLYIHAKVIIVDGKKAELGSINFTKSSLDDNRELSVITTDPIIVKQLGNTFDQDWQAEGGKTSAKRASHKELARALMRLERVAERYLSKL